MAGSFARLESGYCEAQGRRDTMEDAHVLFEDILAVQDIGLSSLPGQRVAFFGVYDGHGGVDAAKMVQEHLHKSIVKKPEFQEGKIEEAMLAGFAETDELIVSESNTQGWMNGSTGVVGVIVDHTLYIGNVGDSEACLVGVKDGKVTPENLTTPHKASDATEKKRIEELGGHVFFGRVFGALAVSRSFGDSKFKKPKTSQNFVSCEPAMRKVTISSHHKFMILACDGLWDVMNHDSAANFAHTKINEGKSAADVASALVNEALRLKTEDNVTVVVVIFKWDQNGSNASHTNVEHATGDNTHDDSNQQTSEEQSIPETPEIITTEEPAPSTHVAQVSDEDTHVVSESK